MLNIPLFALISLIFPCILLTLVLGVKFWLEKSSYSSRVYTGTESQASQQKCVYTITGYLTGTICNHLLEEWQHQWWRKKIY